MSLCCRAAKGCRKVVIATNVAESSITIEKIRYVIDSGLFKQSDFVSLTRVSLPNNEDVGAVIY